MALRQVAGNPTAACTLPPDKTKAAHLSILLCWPLGFPFLGPGSGPILSLTSPGNESMRIVLLALTSPLLRSIPTSPLAMDLCHIWVLLLHLPLHLPGQAHSMPIVTHLDHSSPTHTHCCWPKSWLSLSTEVK